MLLRDLGHYIGTPFRDTPLDGVLDLEGFPLVYKGFLHYTLPGDAPGMVYWIMLLRMMHRRMMHWIMHQLMVLRMMHQLIMHRCMMS